MRTFNIKKHTQKTNENYSLTDEDTYNRIDYRIRMRILLDMKIDPYVIMWIGRALLKRNVDLRVGPWTLEVKTITPGLPQESALSSVLFNVYTVGHHIQSTGGAWSNPEFCQ